MNPDGKKVGVWHSADCKCKILDGALYVAETCRRTGHHLTKRRLQQILYAFKKSLPK